MPLDLMDLHVLEEMRDALKDIAKELRNINKTLNGIREDETIRGRNYE